MKDSLRFPVLVFIVCALTLGACKKKDNSVSDLKIAGIEYSFAGSVRNYRFVYDRNNNMDSIVWVGSGASSGSSGFKKFIYFGSSFSITDEHSNTYTVQANTNGQILKVMLPDTVIVYYKNGVAEVVEHKTGTTKTSQAYFWSGGNVVTTRQPGDTLSFYYDAGISGQAGDPWRVDDLIAYGRSYIKTTHLPLGATRRTDTGLIYSYQYDTRGRISRLLRVSRRGGASDTAIYSYRYY